jgi:collectin sub-family protein 11
VGLNDLAEEGTFTWADGSPLLYEYWNANEPNDWGNGEDCGQVLASGLWNDIPCGNGMWSVCKMPVE